MDRRKFVLSSTSVAALTGMGNANAWSRYTRGTRSSPAPSTPKSPASAPVQAPTAAPAPVPKATPPAPTAPPTAATARALIDAVAAIKALRIPSGPLAGGYEIAPNGKLNWYFAALGLLPMVRMLNAAELETYIRSYLDLYLRTLNPSRNIDDFELPYGRANPSVYNRVLSDSDDSYAATFLSLAVRYVRASGNVDWWDTNAPVLKEIAYRNVALSIKPNGLTSVFQLPRSQTNSIGYLMDNCVVYRGMRDFAAMLRQRGDVNTADYYDRIATGIATSLGGLFSGAGYAFRASDAHVAPEAGFYPGTTCQIFPQAFGVAELSPHFTQAWTWLNVYSPSWETGQYDAYPWAVLGFVAAQRGMTAQATAHLTGIENTYATNPSVVTINELGFYHRAAMVLSGKPDV